MERLSERHEREYAQMVPHTVQVVASGAVLDKHDGRSVQTEDNEYWRFRHELKCTIRKSYSLKRDEWLELAEYAALRGERPVWAIRFYEPGEQRPNHPIKADLVCVGIDDWIELLEELDRLRGEKEGH